jgi:hypothetical protein
MVILNLAEDMITLQPFNARREKILVVQGDGLHVTK